MSRDQKFFDMYSLVIGVLVVFALGIYVLATKMSERTQGVYTRDTAEYQAAVAERIRPVGEVYMPGEEQEASVPVAAAIEEPEPVATTMTGPQVYNAACLACHSTGAGGSPVVGDTAQWADRIAQGIDVLYDHAINGFDGDAPTPMLPKGGRVDLSDQEVRDAVDYMIESTLNAVEDSAAATESVPPVTEPAKVAEEQQAPAPVAPTVQEPEPVASAMTGEQVYNSACLACHSTGVGGAPIVGDVAQWTQPIARGIDTLYDHAINGFDGEALTPMLPKGGRVDLSDQEVRDAVDYMVAESS